MRRYLFVAAAMALSACSGSDSHNGMPSTMGTSTATPPHTSPSGLQTGVSSGSGSGTGGGVGEDTYGANMGKPATASTTCPPGQVLVSSGTAQSADATRLRRGVSNGSGSGTGGGVGEDTVGGARDYACVQPGMTGATPTGTTPAHKSPSGLQTGVSSGSGSGSGGGVGEDTMGGARGATTP